MKKIILIMFLFVNSMLFANVNAVVSIAPQETFVKAIGGDKVNVSLMVKSGNSPHTYEPKPSQMRDISKADLYFTIGIEFEEAWLPKFTNQNKKMLVVHVDEHIKKIEMAEHDEHEAKHEAKHEEDHDDHKDEAKHEDDHDDHKHEADHKDDHDDHKDEAEHKDDHDDHKHEADHKDDHDDHKHEGDDPHVWTSPKNVKIIAKNIYDALVKTDKANQKYYKTNLDKFFKADK